MKRNYWWQLLIAIDQLANVILAGWADETISSRCYRTQHKKRWSILQKIVDTLFFFDKQKELREYVENGVIKYYTLVKKHCQLSYEHERERGHTPVGLREA